MARIQAGGHKLTELHIMPTGHYKSLTLESALMVIGDFFVVYSYFSVLFDNKNHILKYQVV